MSLVLCISKNVARPETSVIGGGVVEITSKGPVEGIFPFEMA